MDISSVLENYELVEKITESEGNRQYLEYVVVLVILWEAGIGRARITEEKIIEIIKRSLSFYQESIPKDNK